MKHNLKGVFRLTEARTFWVRAVRAWRELLPDWRPTLDALRSLENMPREHRAAVQIVSHGWDSNDPRWDVLMALLEWERREERHRRWCADELTRLGQEMESKLPAPPDEFFERLREDTETTVETALPKAELKLVPKPGVPRVFTVRTLASLRKEQADAGDHL